jgi:hypothetical protein
VLDLPPWILGHLDQVHTHSYPEAPMVGGAEEYPLLVFSHGLQGYRTQNTIQAEEFASQGYVVVAIDHTYASAVVVFPGDRAALFNHDLMSDEFQAEGYHSPANRLVSTWAADISFVLDRLELYDSGDISSPFGGRLDLERVGVYGHSTGGGATVQVCWQDERCTVGLGMDAWVEPVSDEVLVDGLAQPFMFMSSDGWGSGDNGVRLNDIYQGLDVEGYRLAVEGSAHYDFADLPLLSPAATALGLKGPIDGRRMLEIVQGYTLAFFDHHLRGQPAPLLDGPSADYPEVAFESH